MTIQIHQAKIQLAQIKQVCARQAKLIVIFCFLLMSLSGCREHQTSLFGSYKPDSPEHIALSFFTANYEKNDLKSMLELSSPEYARTIGSYVTAKSYSRYILNLQYESGVEINVDRSFREVSETSNTDLNTSVTVLFTGQKHGKTVKDLKRVSFIKLDEKWLIDSIDPVV